MLGDVFSHFANAVLERTLPSVLAWLRDRFGEDVLLDRMTVDGPRIRLENGRIPLGTRYVLVADSATFVANEQVTEGKVPLRLAHLDGEIRVSGESAGEPPRFVMPVHLFGEQAFDGAWVAGRVDVRGARWLVSMGEGGSLDGSMRVRITQDRWSITDGRAKTGGEGRAQISFFGEGRLDGGVFELRLGAVDARAGDFLDALVALVGGSIRVPFTIPRDAMVDADLQISRDQVRGRLVVRTATSNLVFEPFAYSFSDRAFDGTQVTGALSTADAMTLGVFSASPWLPSEGEVRIDARISGRGLSPRLEGRIETPALSFRLASRPELPPLVLERAEAGLEWDREHVAVRGLSANVFGGRLALDLAFAFAEPGVRTRIELIDARDSLRPFVEALLGRPLPGRLRLDVNLASDAARVVRGSVRLGKPKSELSLDLVVDPSGSLEGSKLSSMLALEDLYDLTRALPVRATGRGRILLEGAIEGSLRSPAVLISIRTEEVKLLVAHGESAWLLPIDRAAARVHIDAERLLLTELRVHAFGGRVVAKGLHAKESDGDAHTQVGFRGTQAKIEVVDVGVGALPILSGGPASEVLDGRLRGVVTLTRRAGRLAAKGRVTIDDPQYRAIVRALRTPLARFGLKPPGPRGVGPLEAELVANEKGFTLKGLHVAVQGVAIRGDVLVSAAASEAKPTRWEGGPREFTSLGGGGGAPSGKAVAGALEARLDGSYLRTSSLLRVPASVVGDVSIPVRVRGTLAAPTFEADGLAVLDRMIKRVDLGRGLQHAVESVIDEVLSARSESRSRAGQPDKVRTGLSDQAIFERIVDGVSHRTEDKLVDVLLERGLSPDEIATGIEEARERRR